MTSSLMIFRKKKTPQVNRIKPIEDLPPAIKRFSAKASAVVLRKYRRLRRRRTGIKGEYKKLNALLPKASKDTRLKKAGVVDAAYRYICQLQDALVDKFSTTGLPEDLAGVIHGQVRSSSDIQALALHLIKTTGCGNPFLPSWPPTGISNVTFGSMNVDSRTSNLTKEEQQANTTNISSDSSETSLSSPLLSSSSSSSSSSFSSSPISSKSNS